MRLFLSSFVSVLLGFAVWNLYADANGRFGSIDPALFQAWPAEHAMRIEGTIPYRAAKRALAKAAAAPDLLVLGNSHLFGARQSALPAGQTILNLCVPAGDLEDVADFWALMKAQGKIPKAVLMPLEPVYINGEGQRFLRAFHRPDYLRYLWEGGLPWGQRSFLLAWQLKHSFKGTCDGIVGWSSVTSRWGAKNYGFLPVDKVLTVPKGQGFAADGHEKKKGFESGHQSEAVFWAREHAAKADRGYGLREWKPHPARMALWRSLLADMRAQGCQVWILSTPIHSATRKVLAAYDGPTQEAVRWVQSLEAEGLIQKLHKSSDGSFWGCSDKEFFDGGHPASSCIDKILRQWTAIPAKPAKLR